MKYVLSDSLFMFCVSQSSLVACSHFVVSKSEPLTATCYLH